MNLHAILSYYDESPTWLASTIASLSRIGVDHVLALDGKFPHFDIGAPACSPVEQAEAILHTAAAAGMAVTLHRPTVLGMRTETQKRELAFQVLGLLATPFTDWVLVIDADEIVEAGTPKVREELAALDAGTHTAACRIASVTDPHADPAADNSVNSKTEEIHQKLLVHPRFASMQSRFWRVLTDMRVGPTHFDYTGVDEHGERVYLRKDIGSMKDFRNGLRCTPVERVDGCELLHRKNHRIAVRQQTKRAYYDLRDEIGLEQPPDAVAT